MTAHKQIPSAISASQTMLDRGARVLFAVVKRTWLTRVALGNIRPYGARLLEVV